MVKYILKEAGQLKEYEEYKPNAWINITPPITKKELLQIANEFDIPEDFLTDAQDINERSRYEKDEESSLIVVNTPILNPSEGENEAYYITAPIGIIQTGRNLITITATQNPVMDRFVNGLVKNFNPQNEKRFILQIFDQVTLQYIGALNKLNLKRHLIEEELYNSSRNKELKQLLKIEKSLVYFVNSISSNDLVLMKMKRTDVLRIREDEDLSDYFEDIIIDDGQALEMANVHTNILSGTMEAYASIVSNNLNQFIQKLTIITIILMVPTLVASFYGMNVELPFSRDPNTFFYLLIGSIILSLIIVWIFYRRK